MEMQINYIIILKAQSHLMFIDYHHGTFMTVNQLKLRAAYGQSGNFAPFGAIYSPLVPAIFNGNTGSLVGLTRGNADHCSLKGKRN